MTKSDIIAAAFQTWGRELYQTTSLTGLARSLGVTKPALYRHFKSKQALLQEMYDCFFDNYAAAIKPHYDRALKTADPREGLLILARAIIEYYGRNVDLFVFSLIKVYTAPDVGNMVEQLRVRGIDMRKFRQFGGNGDSYPSVLQLIIVSLTFGVAYFHCYEHEVDETPSDEAIQGLIASLEEIITGGLGFKKERIDGISYGLLERLAAERTVKPREEDGLFRAVAGVVAEMGPWNASMDMVARRSGLSKSGLYAHFRSKQDMLRQLFMIEFQRMADHTEACINGPEIPEEQFYLAVIGIANYLRSRPEILVAVDWLRARRLDLGVTVPPRIYKIFSDIRVSRSGGEAEGLAEKTSQWVLFLVVNTLMRRLTGMELSGISNDSFRILYRFITLGVEGFNI